MTTWFVKHWEVLFHNHSRQIMEEQSRILIYLQPYKIVEEMVVYTYHFFSETLPFEFSCYVRHSYKKSKKGVHVLTIFLIFCFNKKEYPAILKNVSFLILESSKN